MKTLLLTVDKKADIERCGAILEAGGLVAFPTETVYGLGARADDEKAVEHLYAVKERSRGKKCAILIAQPQDMMKYVDSVGECAKLLAQQFWPGPLTIVIGDEDPVGMRCPAHADARRMLRAAGVPVYAPSANVSGQQPAKSAEEVFNYFEGKIDAVLDGGRVEGGISSTVVKVENGSLEILRSGPISRKDLYSICNEKG